MRKLLNILIYIIYCKSDSYLVKENYYYELRYKQYYLYRIDRLLFIKFKRLIDEASSNSSERRNRWFYNYINIKQI